MIPYVPNIVDYKPFYIQKDGDSAIDTAEKWGMVAKEHPYPAMPDPKTPYNNDWKDEDGDDEYTTAIYYQAFEFEVEFYMKAYDNGQFSATELLRFQTTAFFNYVKSGEFSVYGSYTGLGLQSVRYAGYEETRFLARNDWAMTIFKVKFKANDPTTRMVYYNGNIVAASTIDPSCVTDYMNNE